MSDTAAKRDELRSNHLRNPIKRGKRGAGVSPHISKEDAHKRAYGKGREAAPKERGQGEEEGLPSSHASLSLSLFS